MMRALALRRPLPNAHATGKQAGWELAVRSTVELAAPVKRTTKGYQRTVVIHRVLLARHNLGRLTRRRHRLSCRPPTR